MLTPLQMRRLRESLSKASADRLKGFYSHPSIPERKLRNAVETCALRPDVVVLALIDFTMFGSAKEALLICADGLHYRWPHEVKPKTIPFAEFRTLRVSSSMGVVHIGPDHAFVAGSMGHTALAQLLIGLQPLLEDLSEILTTNAPPFRAVFTGSNLDGLWVRDEADTKTPTTIATWCVMKGASSETVARVVAGSYRVIRSTKHGGWFCMFGPPELDPDET